MAPFKKRGPQNGAKARKRPQIVRGGGELKPQISPMAQIGMGRMLNVERRGANTVASFHAATNGGYARPAKRGVLTHT